MYLSKKRIYHLVMLASLLFSLSSCEKYLDKKSDNSLVVPTTLNDLQALLDNADIMNYNTPSLAEASADDYFLETDTYNALPVEEQYKYNRIPTDYRFQNDWSLGYSAVYPANICLERIGDIAVTNANRAQWNNVKGSALFYRAFYFAALAASHAKSYDPASYDTDAGIVLRLTSDINVASVRASVKETYDRIIDDARSAAALLPGNPSQVIRPSKAAAYGLLARTFLNMRMYDSAGKYAEACLGIKSDLMDYNDPSAVDVSAEIPFMAYNSETIFYSTMNNVTAFFHGNNDARTDTVLFSFYADDDIRKTAFFGDAGNYKQFRGNYAGNPDTYFSGIATDELYLIKAEALARSGNKAAALETLNQLLMTRWATGTFVPVTAATDVEALGIILQERRKELLMRGLRWADVKRLNKEGASINLMRMSNGEQFLLPPNDRRYALPLPIDVIESAHLQQN